MRVVALEEYRNRKLVAVTRELNTLAEAGVLRGLTFVAKLGPDDHRAGVAGDYRRNRNEAIASAVRLNSTLASNLDLFEQRK